MDAKAWEDICRRCGECCFEKWIDGDGRVRETRIACRHLDIVTRECRVYHKRFDVGENCVELTPEVVRSASWLPRDCSYRRVLSARSPEPDETSAASCSSSQRLLEEPSPPE